MSKKRIRVGVIFGGQSGEHEVSIVSARSIIDTLDSKKYAVVPIAITRRGQWLSAQPSRRYLKTAAVGFLAKGFKKKSPAQDRGLAFIKSTAEPEHLDVIFPIIHGTSGEDGTLQGFLELTGLPYVGSGVLGSAVGMDKVIQKQLVLNDGIPVAPFQEVRHRDWQKNTRAESSAIKSQIGFPCFVKPANLGSSVGISRVDRHSQLNRALTLAFSYDTKVIVEQAVVPAREFECAVLGNESPRASLVGEIVPDGEFYDYRAKYVSDRSQTIVPARIPSTLAKRIRTTALKVFRLLNASGMARVDFLYQTKRRRLFFSEINTAPGFTSISMYAKLWQATGLAYSKLLDRLITLALERHRLRKNLKTKITTSSWYRI